MLRRHTRPFPMVERTLPFLACLSFLFTPLNGEAETPFSVVEQELAEVLPTTDLKEMKLSPDGRQVMQLATADGKCFISINGTTSPAYDGITKDSMRFSQDGAHYCYGAAIGDRRIVVIDGLEFPAFDGCAEGIPLFSPDGHHFAFVTVRGGRLCMVLDGKPGPAFNSFGKVPPLFSPNSKRFAYLGRDRGGAFVMLDGTRYGDFENVAAMAFSADSLHFAFIAMLPHSMTLFVDGKEAYHDAQFIKGSLAFDSPSKLHVLQQQNGRILRIQVDLPISPR